jgi:hypothetical protein
MTNESQKGRYDMNRSEPSSSTAKDDLAFMKALVFDGGRSEMAGGQAFFVAGLCFGAQCFLQWAQAIGLLVAPVLVYLTIAVLPSVIFLGFVIYLSLKERNAGPKPVAARAVNAAFTSAGIGNLFISSAFGYTASIEKSMTVWLLYPVVICVFQGAVWYIAYIIRKKIWLAAVSVAWFSTSVALTILLKSIPDYLLVLGFALVFIMGGSGYYMMRLAAKKA